jgi:hypothetical protein
MKQLFKLLLAMTFLTGSGYAFAKPHSISDADSLETVNKKLPGFSALHISGPFDVYVEQGSIESVTFQAPKEILDRIVTEVKGNTLRISNKHDNWGWGPKSWWSDKGWWQRHRGKIIVHVTVKDLNSIKVSGSGGAFFDNGISTQSLSLLVRGSGNVRGKVSVKTLESHISGSGNIKLSGTAGNSTIKVSGSGNFSAPGLITSNSAVRVSGSGNAKINATDKVDAAVSGSGDVRYTGDAKSVRSAKSGSGNVSRF